MSEFFQSIAFPWVIGEEGGFQNDPSDKGNWTGGAVGFGELKGTKYGISAASFPSVDIANLTLEGAYPLAKSFYWDKFSGDLLPQSVALAVFDFGINAGIHESVVCLQRALGITTDGVVGPETVQWANSANPGVLIQEFTMQRIKAYQQMPEYPQDGAGWVNRANATCHYAMGF